MEGLNWYYNTMIELLNKDDKYSNDEVVLLIQDCEDSFSIEKSEGYVPYTCNCGVKWEIRYIGTKRDILGEVECDLLEHKYGGQCT